MKYWFKRKYNQINRVLSYLPLIWKAYDWDYQYALDVFKHQLNRLATQLESDSAYSLSAKYDASKIRTAIKLMDKVYKEEYATEYIDTIEKRYGKTRYDFVEVEEKDEYGEPYCKMVHSNEFALDEEHQKEIDEVKHQMFLLCRDKQERAHRLLWKYIEHHIQRWWD